MAPTEEQWALPGPKRQIRTSDKGPRRPRPAAETVQNQIVNPYPTQA